MNSLRDKIETLVLTGFNHADEQGAYKICANEVIKEIEKRIDERIDRLLKIKEPVPAQILLKCSGLEEAKMILTTDDKKTIKIKSRYEDMR